MEKQIAEQILNEFPSWENIWGHINTQIKMPHMVNMMYQTASKDFKWEAYTWLLNNAYYNLRGQELVGNYYCFKSGKKWKGEGTLYSFDGTEYEFKSAEFLAILKIMLCINFEMKLESKHQKLYDTFRISTPGVFEILN
jgi:hypothetical protein